MAMVKVWNMNQYPLHEMFRDQEIKIPPGRFIIMDEDDARNYRGQYKPPILGADGEQDPRGFKMLKIEPHEGPSPEESKSKSVEYNCHVCAYAASSESDLQEHCDLNHLDQLADPELAAKRKAEIAKKGGRPSKNHNTSEVTAQ